MVKLLMYIHIWANSCITSIKFETAFCLVILHIFTCIKCVFSILNIVAMSLKCLFNIVGFLQLLGKNPNNSLCKISSLNLLKIYSFTCLKLRSVPHIKYFNVWPESETQVFEYVQFSYSLKTWFHYFCFNKWHDI